MRKNQPDKAKNLHIGGSIINTARYALVRALGKALIACRASCRSAAMRCCFGYPHVLERS